MYTWLVHEHIISSSMHNNVGKYRVNYYILGREQFCEGDEGLKVEVKEVGMKSKKKQYFIQYALYDSHIMIIGASAISGSTSNGDLDSHR